MLLPALWDFVILRLYWSLDTGAEFRHLIACYSCSSRACFLTEVVSTAEKSFVLRNAPREMSWFCKEAQKWLVRGAEAVAFHVTFVSGPDKGLTAPAGQDFPSCTCCHYCIKGFVLTGISLRVKNKVSPKDNYQSRPFLSLLQYCKSSLNSVLVL